MEELIETIKKWAPHASLGELNTLYKLVSDIREEAINEVLYSNDEDEPYWNR